MQSHPLCRMRFVQYQASLAVLVGLGDEDWYLMQELYVYNYKMHRVVLCVYMVSFYIQSCGMS